jgi:hypothetical protein
MTRERLLAVWWTQVNDCIIVCVNTLNIYLPKVTYKSLMAGRLCCLCWLMVGRSFNVTSNSQGHISDEAETLIPPLLAARFEEYEGIFDMHCSIDRAAHTRLLMNQSWACYLCNYIYNVFV